MSTEIDFQMNFEQDQQSDADKKLLVAFFREPVKNEAKSIEAGRPIFDERDMIKIITPGSRDSFIGDATEHYQVRFPQQWARYKAGKDQANSGTPLKMLPWLTMAQIAEFNALNIQTVEQLVGMSDAVSHRFMGHHQIKARAQTYLDAAAGMAPMLRLEQELQSRDDTIAQMKEQLDALSAKVAAQAAAQVPIKAPTKG